MNLKRPLSRLAVTQSPKVALLFEATNSYARNLLVGVGEYLLSHGPWHIHYSEIGITDPPPSWLSKWDGNGIIIRGENRRLARFVKRLPIPVVDLTPSRLIPWAPWVKTDDVGVAALAARHFLERGFRNYAFCGVRRPWSAHRGAEFRRLVQEAGHSSAHHVLGKSGADDEEHVGAIDRWLAGLPKPVAVFACYDNVARQVLEACRRRGLNVPEEVAVLGVDNDEVLCALSTPPLSSVVPNPRRVGWDAVELLARMMKGENVDGAELLIPPLGVTTRQSTDVLAISDPKISRALRFIREHACEGITVGEVLQQCPMARRALETRFVRLLGRTPHQEIQRVRLIRAKELLVGTRLPVWEIAERTGYGADYFSVVFEREVGLTPGVFRRKFSIGTT